MYYLTTSPIIDRTPNRNVDQLTNIFYLYYTTPSHKLVFTSPVEIQTALINLSQQHNYLNCKIELGKPVMVDEEPISLTEELLSYFPGSTPGQLLRHVGFEVHDINEADKVEWPKIGFLESFTPGSLERKK